MIEKSRRSLWESDKNDSSSSTGLVDLFVDIDINTFRKIGQENKRLGTWDPIDESTRYYRSLMYEFCFYLEEKARGIGLEFSDLINPVEHFIKNIRLQDLGGAVTIKFKGCTVSLDYLLAVEEMVFLHRTMKNVETVTEIGAGFGRTAHSILSNYDITTYNIVDLPEMLDLSSKYLKKVLPKRYFSKIRFAVPQEVTKINNTDLVINIDSMQEMPKETVLMYMEWIYSSSNFFFTKNAMGKYDPSEIDLKVEDQGQLDTALSMGLVCDLYHLFDTESIEVARKKYLKSYCPVGFELIRNQRGFGQYLFYELALYKRQSEDS